MKKFCGFMMFALAFALFAAASLFAEKVDFKCFGGGERNATLIGIIEFRYHPVKDYEDGYSLREEYRINGGAWQESNAYTINENDARNFTKNIAHWTRLFYKDLLNLQGFVANWCAYGYGRKTLDAKENPVFVGEDRYIHMKYKYYKIADEAFTWE